MVAAQRQRRRGRQSAALVRSYDELGEIERAARARACGWVSAYGCSGCGAVHARHAFHCGERLCVWCARARGARLGEALLPLVQGMARPWFLTLTVRNGLDLAERAKHLRAAFKKLRQRVWWKAHVAGGVAVEEVTRNAQTGEWHPHLHLIIDAEVHQVAVLQVKLAALWLEVTGDSFILDLRPLRGATVAHDLRELCKYTAKISDIVDSPALVRVYLDYARRRRLIVTFGSCYGTAREAALSEAEAEKPTQECTDVEQQPCPSCGQLGTLRHDPSRRWRMESVAPIGGGWYVPWRTDDDWRAVRARRARLVPVVATM